MTRIVFPILYLLPGRSRLLPFTVITGGSGLIRQNNLWRYV
jgi:hypothetical protein